MPGPARRPSISASLARRSPFDPAAARALLQGADLGDTASAEAATGYYWGEPKLRPLVERILARRGRMGTNGWNSWPSGFSGSGSGHVLLWTGIDRETSESVEFDEALNPHRAEEQPRAQQHAAELLAQRGVLLPATRPMMSWPICGRPWIGSSPWSRPAAATP